MKQITRKTIVALFCALFLIGCDGNSGETPDADIASDADDAGEDTDDIQSDADEIDDDSDLIETDAEQDGDAPPEDLSGPPCPEPPHSPIDESWPEVFVGIEDCDDEGPGTEDAPFCTFTRAFEVADSVPYIMTILDGEYRLYDDPNWDGGHSINRPGTADEYFVLRAAEGARPVILASIQIPGSDFEERSAGQWRVSVDHIPNTLKGLWTSEGERIIHLAADGGMAHADASELVEPGMWTVADSAGNACPEADHSGCFIYMIPPSDMNVEATNFEVSQSVFLGAVTPAYVWIDGITVFYTQPTALFFENTDFVVIQNSHFAHIVNSVDNSYGLHLWDANGTIVRNNVVHDSRYWRGYNNSHGITFMVAGDEEPNWVCGNEVFDIVGGCVSNKGGVSNLHVVGNYLHDCGDGIRVSTSRCHWKGCDTRLYPGGDFTIRENLIVDSHHGIKVPAVWNRPEAVIPSRIYNNTFVNNEGGIGINRRTTIPEIIRNNMFIGSGYGIEFEAGGEETWPDYYLGLGLDSDYNFFGSEDGAVYVIANWSGLERGFTLDEYRAEYDSENASLNGDPLVDSNYVPTDESPAIGSGDPSVYEGASTTDIGMWPHPR